MARAVTSHLLTKNTIKETAWASGGGCKIGRRSGSGRKKRGGENHHSTNTRQKLSILRKKEPYYSKYVGYKAKLRGANPNEKKWIVDLKARRKVADTILKEIWVILRGL